jgi:hypothetical protein
MLKEYFPTIIHEPKIIKILFDNVEQFCIIVEINGEEYLACEQFSIGDNCWANSKSGIYGSGLGKTSVDQFKPVRVGALGQMAFGKIFGGPVDLVYRCGGDKYDTLLGKYTIDVKCSMKNNGFGLVYHKSSNGRLILLNKDIYVFGFINSENRELKTASVVLVGFLSKNGVSKSDIVFAHRGGHKNFHVKFSKLNSIINLLNYKKQLEKNKKSV